jgi:hypothetical protein
MANIRRRLYAAAHDSFPLGDRGHRHILVWVLTSVLLLVPLVVSAIGITNARRQSATTKGTTTSLDLATGPPQPADLFMQSVATEDGELGWHQLCPDIQSRLPMASLVQQADTMRAQAAQEGVHLTVQPLGTRPQQGGWQLHIYRMTAHWTSGATRQWIFNVLTQPSGCVEDVQGS